MNIVIVGPGNDPKRFGTNFVNKAENAGHSITKFSYRLDNDDPDTIENNFKLTIENLDHIDILLYNSIGGFYPGDFNHYHSGHSVKYKEWQQGILVNAAIPHMMTLACLEKMDSTSRVVFLTSSASYLINRQDYLHLAGYFGTKNVMNHLMRALSTYNDKGVTVCTLAPHIPYEDEVMAEKIMSKLYDTVINSSSKDNGKIIQCYPPEAETFYHEGGVNP